MRPMVYSSNILFDFDAIFDIDLAIARYFKKYLEDSIYVDTDILSSNDEYFYKAILVQRTDKNPIKLFLKPQYADSAELIYNELIADHYEELLTMVSDMPLFYLMMNAMMGKFVTCTVLCKNEYEKQYIKKKAQDAAVKVLDNETKLDMFYCLYIKSFDFLLDHLYLTGKDIYILGYMYNIEPGQKGIPRLDIFKKISKSLKLHTIAPYNRKFIEPI